ncbi:MAG: SDR family NAD(P)-dependent oxidoreductase [Desulfobacteraceae bacterium]|nr:SDR family NAD(P)-dependent oxidoreductase [Desulfobacteraceae bacterium]
MKDLKGKTAFISGGAEGIGFYVARVLGRQGMKVMLGDIDAKMLEQAVQTLKGEGLNVEGVYMDVALKTDWEVAAEKTIQTFGKVHLLIGNAGVAVTGAQKYIQESDWRWIIDVNLMSIVFGTQVFFPLLKAHGEGGHILNVASIAGIHGVSYSGPYCATKAAVVSLSECYRREFEKDGIEVSVLCPGFVKSRVYDSMRNRQARYGGPIHHEDLVKVKPSREMNKKIVVEGIDTDIAANRVLEGLLNNEFYIFTHPHYRDLHEGRAREMTEAFIRADASPALATVPRSGIVLR